MAEWLRRWTPDREVNGEFNVPVALWPVGTRDEIAGSNAGSRWQVYLVLHPLLGLGVVGGSVV